MSGTIEAKVTQRFAVPPERVMEAWLDPVSVREWMAASLRSAGLSGEMGRVEIDARVGGRFAFSDFRADREAVSWGEYRTLDMPSKLAFTWWTSPEEEEADTSLVTLILEPAGTGCVATLFHEMDAVWEPYRARTERGWERMLAALAQWLEQSGS
ncbi:hypothetical protein GCM10011321_35820 [Youhaiella tibetensis]|uniref:SRPBCC domain-containing protein n=1 Tax=Paradevosia tibetensis TaxID=1447062 RepID=A0A5B9DW07_9HYPH|nr:SRPBCC domain-containing protein [Youhaiella tibetensis]AKR57534.1 hypothetical protein XM25_17450 [Devosia sp. H5989]QEE22464.1 SRPBCC domain-containing protein [Youhaiella tibetensis]GGF42038.1 hypothetical protein GCM10011321_35820 [Youhaiella tibetensis]